MPPARKDYSWRRVRNVVAAGASAPVKDVWTISGQFFAEQHAIPGSHPSYRHEEPASPKTCITLLTGGLLVRVQPEEPIPRGNSTTFASLDCGRRARCPFFALSSLRGGGGASNRPTSADKYAGDKCA